VRMPALADDRIPRASHFESEKGRQAMSNDFNPAALPEEHRIAFYGALFAMSAADHHVDKEEIDLIYGSLDLEGLSESSKRTVYRYVLDPPLLRDVLPTLKRADQTMRFGTLMGIVDVALADGVIENDEREALEFARVHLGATPEQLTAIIDFSETAKKVRDRGVDDEVASDMLKRAAGALGAVGVPITIVYFSGAVVGLSAAGITSGLAALGIGLGMIPGIGVAILLGVTLYFTATKILDAGGGRRKRKLAAERDCRAQLVIKNLHESIQQLAARVAELADRAAESEANRAAITSLSERLRSLQQLLSQRQQASAV